MSFYNGGRRRRWLVIFACALFSFSAVTAVRADRAIVTPNGQILAPSQSSIEGEIGLDKTDDSAVWINHTANIFEFEAARLVLPGRIALPVSAQALVLPETTITPNITVGVRDIFGAAHNFRDYGYSGRSVYLAAGMDLFQTMNARYPVRNVSFTLGMGTGVVHGLFGSLTAQLAPKLTQTLEFDSVGINYRLSFQFSPLGRLAYERVHGANFLGLELTTPTAF
jgi:hypothetical protein